MSSSCSDSSDLNTVEPEAVMSVLCAPGRRSLSCWGQDCLTHFQTLGPSGHDRYFEARNVDEVAAGKGEAGRGTHGSARYSGVTPPPLFRLRHTLPLSLPLSGHRPHPASRMEMLQCSPGALSHCGVQVKMRTWGPLFKK